MADINQIDPNVATPAPEGEPASEKTAGLPEEVLKIPAISALLEGSPPAIFAPAGAQSPELKVLEKNLKSLTEAGMGLYQTKDKQNFVLFNGLFVTPEELQAADEAGQIDSIAHSFEEVNAGMGAAFGSGSEAAAPVAPAAGTPPTATASRSLATKRVNNAQPGGPTSGARPGQGRLLNNIQKSVI